MRRWLKLRSSKQLHRFRIPSSCSQSSWLFKPKTWTCFSSSTASSCTSSNEQWLTLTLKMTRKLSSKRKQTKKFAKVPQRMLIRLHPRWKMRLTQSSMKSLGSDSKLRPKCLASQRLLRTTWLVLIASWASNRLSPSLQTNAWWSMPSNRKKCGENTWRIRRKTSTKRLLPSS